MGAADEILRFCPLCGESDVLISHHVGSGMPYSSPSMEVGHSCGCGKETLT